MKEKITLSALNKEISSARVADKEWFLSLLDDEKQKNYEDNHLKALLLLLRYVYLNKEQAVIREAQEELTSIRNGDDHSAISYARTLELNRTISASRQTIESYRRYFDEPYFARMDVQDDKEGYNSYYIGKKGDINLGVVDWRAPLARRYYQKSQRKFSINEYDYEVILRRAIRTHAGKVTGFTNEHLSVREYLTPEEIGGRDEEIILDPYLREIIKARKDEESVKDIIETIQEKQFDLITRPERENFVLQGCAGSGKTMVLLHRLSYLMYNNENLSPRDVLVITPSRSFNDFIDELSKILELEKVRTFTLSDYFTEVLQKAGVNVTDKFNGESESEEYLSYLYSPAYPADVDKVLKKVYTDVYGLFSSEDCREFSARILSDCREQKEAYTRIKNATVRLRRVILGEIKETPEGNLRYTRPFRDFMNHISQVEDFLSFGVEEGVTRSQAYFYNQLRLFYRSAAYLLKNAENVISDTLVQLDKFGETLDKEIKDLRRYRFRAGGKEEYVYADRIAARESLLKESEEMISCVKTIGDKCGGFSEFFLVLRGESYLKELGKCEDNADMVRFFYRMTVKKKKLSCGMDKQGLYRSDVYALTVILQKLGFDLIPHYSLVFVDEGQDISAGEYALLREINKSAAFNIYGDLKQNITPWRGVKSWEELPVDCKKYTLNQNYRNTNRIVEFVGSQVEVDMQPIGFDGQDVRYISVKEVSGFFKEKKGMRAIIALPREIPLLKRAAYNVVSETGKLSKKKINLMSVYESKGLEFSCVAVYDRGMSENERYISYTRALNELAVIRENGKNGKTRKE